MFLWSNLSELDAKYLQLIIITRTPVHTLPATGVKNLMCKSSYLWRTKPQGDGWDLYFFGLLPSVVQPPGFPISPWICQPSQTSLLANHPQRDAPERLGVLLCLKSAGSATSWMQMKGVAGFLLLGESKQNRQWMSPRLTALETRHSCTAARTKPGAFSRTGEDSSSQPLLGSGYL